MGRLARTVAGNRLRIALALTVVILVVEAAAGWLAHSLALLSDAAHILTDVFALALAWFAVVQSQRPADERRTYGYHRVGILAANVNAMLLVLLVAWIAYEAVNRLLHPQPVQGGLVIAAALVAIAVNIFITLQLRADEHGHDLNVRAAVLHVAGDLAASAGVVVAGLIIVLTGWLYADPLISLLIACIVAWSGIRIVLEASNVLLEGTPAGMDLEAVRNEIKTLPLVGSVHDLHVWSLALGQVALSAHVVVNDMDIDTATSEHLIREIEARLCERFEIGHSTIQVEACHPCASEPSHELGEHTHPHPQQSPLRG